MFDGGGPNGTLSRPEWRQERLRYHIPRWIYETTGANCEIEVTGPQVGVALGLSYEELYRAINFLHEHGYLAYRGVGPRVCLTGRGIEYLEVLAKRRESVRD